MTLRATFFVTVIAVVLPISAAAASMKHGFRDRHAPAEAARILNTLPTVDNAHCHWKIRLHTIGCTALVRGETAQLFLWSGGHRVYYRVCVAGVCSKAARAKHIFGRPY